eukprot:scaffold255551_cov28-Attheya_sp.AAC.1
MSKQSFTPVRNPYAPKNRSPNVRPPSNILTTEHRALCHTSFNTLAAKAGRDDFIVRGNNDAAPN